MNENLNISKILKNAPKGIKLWSPICGECELKGITKDVAYPITCLTKDHKGEWETLVFTSKGEYCVDYDNTECVLFPSKENRDWSTFKVSKKHKEFKPYQKVLVKEYCDDKPIWAPELYGYYNTSSKTHYLVGNEWTVSDDDEIIPYESNEDKAGQIVK